ncbi:MAG: hypothetical protein JWM69_963, partial [Candidatus Binatus sp.]|nr:hypothetical protein [Candidatus Binatus sp.]
MVAALVQGLSAAKKRQYDFVESSGLLRIPD